MRDKLIFELDGRRYALETLEVDKVLAVERLSYLPGQGGIVSGVVSLGGEPVTVVDARRALALPAKGPGPEAARKVVVMRSGSRTLGLDIGSAPVTFVWEERHGEREEGPGEGPEGRGPKGTKTAEEGGPGAYAPGDVLSGDTDVELIDWLALFEKAARVLEGTVA